MRAVENLNLSGVDHVHVCTAVSSNRVFFTHAALQLKRSGTVAPRMELVQVGPSMDFVFWRHCLPNDGQKKEAMKTATDKPKKKEKNVSGDVIRGKIGMIYIPDQQVGGMALPSKAKGLKREHCQAKLKNDVNEHKSKKQKADTE